MAIEQQTSRYLPIWLQLKEKKSVAITAPPQFHTRIIKAVKKRRDKDVAFLYQLAESGHKHFIKIHSPHYAKIRQGIGKTWPFNCTGFFAIFSFSL